MIKISWFDRCAGEVEEALEVLPEMDLCSNQVYRQLLRMPSASAKRIALASDENGPVAVIGLLRRKRLVWEPIGNWIFPGATFPVKRGRFLEVVSALKCRVPVAWWRMGAPLPVASNVDVLSTVPVYRLENIAERERYWRSTNYLRHIKNMRNRTRNLEVRVGAVELLEEIVGGWYGKWFGERCDDDFIQSRLIVGRSLEPLGRHVTAALLDGGKLVAGSTNFIHRNELVAGVSYLSPEYRQLGAGVRLIDILFDYADEQGLEAFDLGGGASYKEKWAPISGERSEISIIDPRLMHIGKAFGRARKILDHAGQRFQLQRS